MAAAKKMITVTQTGSENGQAPGMRETLRGLGLGRIRSIREIEDTPSVRGMLFKVRHLVRVDEKAEKVKGK